MRGDLLLKKISAPWCKHCVDLEPQFEKASKMVNEEEIAATLATFDCKMYIFIFHQYD